MASIRNIGTGWRAEVNRNVAGQQVRRSCVFTTKAEAQTWANAVEAELILKGNAIKRIAPGFKHTGLKSYDAIINDAIDSLCIPGIYFLIQGSAIIYIGKSNNVAKRIAGHYNNGMQFSKHYVIPCLPEELDDMERKYIDMFNPEQNRI